MAKTKNNNSKKQNVLPALLLVGAGVALYLYFQNKKRFIVVPGEMSPAVFNPVGVSSENIPLRISDNEILQSLEPIDNSFTPEPFNPLDDQFNSPADYLDRNEMFPDNFEYYQEMKINQVAGYSKNLRKRPFIS